MCRWMAWSGQPLLMDELLFRTQHGLVDQSLHSRMGAETTNGDGFGLGSYGAGDGPGVYHSIAPAWGDPNLLAVDPELFDDFQGSTDSEVLFRHRALRAGQPRPERRRPGLGRGLLHRGRVAHAVRVRRRPLAAGPASRQRETAAAP